jgi:2-polyprenyl-6-methoxyphenol hydroxylase-like FAD-dependent oxidoreductase
MEHSDQEHVMLETLTPALPASTSVLIVGGGPVGLALAGDLGTRGIDCLLIEQSDGSILQPKMDMVGVRTMEFCRRWGLLEEVRNAPYPLDYRQDCVWGTSITGYEFDRESFVSRGDEKPAMGSPQKRERCPQDMFDPILFAFARRQPSVTIRHRCRFLSVEERTDRVVVTVEDLVEQKRKQIEAAYVIGCDGAASLIRTQLGITLSGSPAVTYTTNIIFHSPVLKTLHDKGQFYRFIAFSEKGMWATLVAINGRDNYRMSIVGDDKLRRYTDEEIRGAIRRIVGTDFEFEILSIMPWTRRLMVADSYGTSRVFLAGDAVHMFSPTGGFGMNTGIQDAVDISWKIEAVLKRWGGPYLLNSYEIERRPVGIRNITEAGSNLRRMVMPKCDPAVFEDGERGQRARAEFGRAYTNVMRREWFTTGIHLGYRYEHSPIIVADGTPEPADDPAIYIPISRPGHRAPHVWLAGDGRSTIDLFGHGFTLMQLGDDAPDCARLVEIAKAKGVPVTVFSSSQPDLIFAYEKSLVLVRPDGHVAWRGDELPEDVEDLLAAVCGFKKPRNIPRPEVSFGQRGVFLTTAGQQRSVASQSRRDDARCLAKEEI